MGIANPYLSYFLSLPPACRRDPLTLVDAREALFPDWLGFKNAVASTYAWAVPTEEAVLAIAQHAPRVIEVGAGSGYWAWLLAQAGVDVLAFDAQPPPQGWFPVAPGTEFEPARHPDRALLLCWPPWNTRMAQNALASHAGDTVVYIGEWLGGSAEPRFFNRLATDYEVVDFVAIPQWWMRADVLTIHRRRRR
jgi:hypothetical protein